MESLGGSRDQIPLTVELAPHPESCRSQSFPKLQVMDLFPELIDLQKSVQMWCSFSDLNTETVRCGVEVNASINSWQVDLRRR